MRSSINELQSRSNVLSRQVAMITHSLNRSRDDTLRLPALAQEAGPTFNIKPRPKPGDGERKKDLITAAQQVSVKQFFISPYNALTTKLYNMIHRYAELKRLSASLKNAPEGIVQDETVDEVIRELSKGVDKYGEEYFQQRIARVERKLARRIQKVQRSILRFKGIGGIRRSETIVETPAVHTITIEEEEVEDYVERQREAIRQERADFERQQLASLYREADDVEQYFKLRNATIEEPRREPEQKSR